MRTAARRLQSPLEDTPSVERPRHDDCGRPLLRSCRLDRSGECGCWIFVSLASLERHAPSIECRLCEQCSGVYVRAGQEIARTWLVRREAGASHLPIASTRDQDRHRCRHPRRGAADAVTRLEQSGVLNDDERPGTPEPQARGDRECLTLSGNRYQPYRGMSLKYVEEPRGCVIRQSYDVRYTRGRECSKRPVQRGQTYGLPVGSVEGRP